ncbi:MAG: SRPBCC family protein [Mycobacteriales bacterium]
MGESAKSWRQGPVGNAVSGLVEAGAAAGTRAVRAAVRVATHERVPRRPREIHRAVTVRRPATEVYDFWRDPAALAGAVDRIAGIEVIDERRSRWTVTGPGGTPLSWEAEVTEEVPGELIAWRAAGGGDGHAFGHEGRLELRPAPADQGTELHVRVAFDQPGGPVGAAVAAVSGEDPDQLVRQALRQVKQVLEGGEVIRTEGQPAGRSGLGEKATRLADHRLAAGGRP